MNSKIKTGITLINIALITGYLGHTLTQTFISDLTATASEVSTRQIAGVFIVIVSFVIGTSGLKSIIEGCLNTNHPEETNLKNELIGSLQDFKHQVNEVTGRHNHNVIGKCNCGLDFRADDKFCNNCGKQH